MTLKNIKFYISMLVIAIAYKYFSGLKETQTYRYDSFAPVRESGQAVWYVDGKDYMAAVADAIEAAEAEILIMDWQMSPEIFMKRPDTGVDDLYWRLDKMLMRKADAGVSVYILLYWEPKQIFDIGSDRVLKLLNNHKYISIHRHPEKRLFLWSHHEKMVIVDQSVTFVGGIDLAYGRWDTRDHELMDDFPVHSAVDATRAPDENPLGKFARWIGKDYVNTFFTKGKHIDWDKPLEGYDGVERNEIPRMPWHDVGCAFTGDAVQDAVKHFNDRYNFLTHRWWQTYWDSFSHNFLNTRLINKIFPRYKSKAEENVFNSRRGYNVTVQFLRSVAEWSIGQKPETSILNAYIDAINNSKHFIYIENQFFISSQTGFFRYVENPLQAALVERIVRAHKANEDFHVMLIIPFKPAFPGTLDGNDWNSDALRSIAFWTFASIYHGDDSLLGKLKKENISEETAKKYFSVFSLRTYDLIGRYFVTELVYVHSKMMIVDDRLAIIGSANINDRSMLGDRDSEVAVMIEDLEFTSGKMNGAHYRMGKFAHSLRCDLLEEHLGLVNNRDDLFHFTINDPLAPGFITGVKQRAELNTVGFLIVFGPAVFSKDEVENSEALNRYEGFPVPREATDKAREILKQIKGNLVSYPSQFYLNNLTNLRSSMLDFGGMYVMLNQKQQAKRTTAFA